MVYDENNTIFNDALTEEGYSVKITAGGSWIITLNSSDIARNNRHLIVNTINGEPLPKKTPKVKSS